MSNEMPITKNAGIDSIVPQKNTDPKFVFEVGEGREGKEKPPVWVRLKADLSKQYYANIYAELVEGDERGGEVDEAVRAELAKILLSGGQLRTAEGIMHQPNQLNGTLIVFTPGLPGDSNVWFEKNHVPILLEKGYTVLALRHLGTKAQSGVFTDEAKTTDKSSVYVNCAEREAMNEPIGGENEQNLETMALEGAVAINAIGQNFKEIKFVSHSAGAVHTLYDFASGAIDKEHLPKVSSIINLSGYIGGDDEKYRTFTPLEYYEWCKQFINMGDANTNVALVKRMFQQVYENPSAVPGSAMVVSVNPPDDEYVTLTGAENFQQVLKRGLVIDDRTQSKELYGGDVHDLANLQPETLVRLLNMSYPKSKHTVSVHDKKGKQK
ncbi:MAG: hypothetical protein UW24_C0004G0031 [Parcubacteria group bacterium GW2011_GWA2_44_12]|nr:MAG: hypothetical protein UW24_C0004G0031 [Parcubacteria group bacterium GW2011_GWA2_44_12]